VSVVLLPNNGVGCAVVQPDLNLSSIKARDGPDSSLSWTLEQDNWWAHVRRWPPLRRGVGVARQQSIGSVQAAALRGSTPSARWQTLTRRHCRT